MKGLPFFWKLVMTSSPDPGLSHFLKKETTSFLHKNYDTLKYCRSVLKLKVLQKYQDWNWSCYCTSSNEHVIKFKKIRISKEKILVDFNFTDLNNMR